MSQGSDDFNSGRNAAAFPYARIPRAIYSLKVLAIACFLVCGLALSAGVSATVFEDTDFTETEIARPDGNPWVGVVGLQFVEDGSRAFAWEREGRVWVLDDNAPVATPFLDISDEVLGWRDHGMLGFALDPGFRSNGYVYLLYAVDRHHVDYCVEDPAGTGRSQCDLSNYDPAFSILETRATVGRLTRYQAVQPDGEADYLNATEIDYDSRTVLLGATLGPDACPILYDTHGVGSLAFGTDGSLLAACGDSGRAGRTDSGSERFTAWQEGINDGLIRDEENVGAFRAQMINSHSGKILRIDPATGDGLASNPYYQAAAPRSAASRVWTLGVRNGYRMIIKPGTGSHDPADGDPGVLYLGDVGWMTWEDFHTVPAGGANLGWPLFEGIEAQTDYVLVSPDNQDAPNPLAGGSCDSHFNFTDLIIQQTQAASPSWPNPCDSGQEITSVETFQHLAPVLDWQHGVDLARFPAYGAGGGVVAVEVGQTGPDGSSVSGVSFNGSASTAGVYYTGDDFPAAYKNTYFHADYGAQWIRNLTMDANDQVVSVSPFLSDTGGVVFMTSNPASGSLYYISWASFVRKVSYAPGGNRPPTASFTATPLFGSAPLSVSLDASASDDPEGASLSYDWDFGDGGSSSTGPLVNHEFDPGDGQPAGYQVTLTVTDDGGASDSTSLTVSPNNSPPVVSITSPVDGTTYSTSAVTNLPLTADLSDAEHNVSSLVCSWEVVFHHNDHIHSDPPMAGCSQSTNVGPTSCTSEAFWYSVRLTVTDPVGLTTSARSRIFPGCGGAGPTANADVASTYIGGTVDIPVLSNDSDDGWVNHHTIELVTLPTDGIALVDEITGLVSYQHTGSSNTTDFISYRVRDNHGNLSAEATVTVTVSGTAPNDPPVLDPITPNPTVAIGDTLTISVSATDTDGPPLLQTSVENLPAGASYVDSGSGAGEFSWTPVPGDETGSPYSVTFKATDGAGATDTEIVSITVAPAVAGFQQDPATGLLSIEAENFDTNTSQGGHSWVEVSGSASSGNEAMEATPNNGTNNNTGFTTNSPQLDFLVNFTQTGTHYIWIRGLGPASTDDSVHVGLNGSASATSDRITGWGSAGWSWSDETMDNVRATINVTAEGEQTLNLWMREDGVLIDKIVLTTDSSLVPTSFGSTGPAESPRGPPQPSLQFSQGVELFTVDEGETAQQTSTVSLDTSNSQAVAYTIGSDAGWLTTTPAGGTTPSASITIEADPSGLPAGQYTGTLTVSATGYLDDTIDVTLTVTGSSSGFQQDPSTGLISIEVESNDANVAQGGHTWTPYPSGSASGGTGFEATPNNGTNNNTGYEANSPRLDFLVNFTQVGTHYVWVRGQGPRGADDSVHVGLNGSGQSTSDRISGFARSSWSWTDETMDGPRATINVTAPGEQFVNLWMREDGVRVDKIVITTNSSLQPVNNGPPESTRGPPQPSLQFSQGTAIFSVDEGETSLQTQNVTLDSSDAQAASFTISSDAGWLSTSPTGGTTPSGAIAIEADPTGLSAGQYTGTLTASATGYLIDTIDVTLTVVGASVGFQQDPSTGLVSIETENFDSNTPQGGHSWSPLSSGSASGGAGLEATPNNGTNNNTGYESNSPQLDYLVNFTQVGTHYVWVRGLGPASTDDSVHVGLNGSGQSTSDRITEFNGSWTWSNETMDNVPATIEVSAPGEQFLNLWMREDGVQVDKIVLTTDAGFQPTSFGSTGPPESPRGPPQPSLQFSQGTASFSVDVGETTLQTENVTLNTSDSEVVSYTLASNAGWLTTSPTGGSTPSGTISIEADPTGLSAGQYTGTVTASATGYNNDTISVTLNVQADLFVTYDFSTGDESDWTTVEASGDIADWDVVGGQYRQLVPASSTAAGTDTYILGSYVFLNSQGGLDDFELSVEVTPEATAFARRGDDVGIMFRYVDDDNYYRLSVNSKFGQTRLERRIAGQFSTIAVTSHGYLPDQTMRLGVRIQGNAMLLYRDYGGASSVLDGDPYFAGYDSGIPAGTVALYAQSEAAFDNVVLNSLSPASRVGMVRPVPFQVDGDNSVATQAVVINPGGSPAVGFEIDSVACGATTETQPQLFEATCTAVGSGEHEVEAILNDPTEVDRDTAPAIATGGVEVLTLGNSNTNGTGDQFITDNIGLDIDVGGIPAGPRQVAFRGYQTVVHDQLTTDSSFTMSSVFFNEGIPGDTTDQLVYDRLPSILERHPDFNEAFVMIGTNEANSNSPPPSGLGCSGASCTNTYKGQLLDLVDILDSFGVQPIIARMPPIFGHSGSAYSNPFGTSTRNTAVQEYNAAAGEVISERSLQAGPDFFDEFLGDSENRFTLFDDFLHPNSLGHRWMANSWKQVLSPDGSTIFVLEGICVRRTNNNCINPTPYKQNLRDVGDTYYLDRSYTLTSIPSLLADGVWLLPENDDKSNSRSDHLEFNIDRDADVYVAFTPTASSLPNWMAPFSSTGQVVGVTAGTPTLDLYVNFYSAGSTITLGGSVAAGISGGGNNNYVVIVVPR